MEYNKVCLSNSPAICRIVMGASYWLFEYSASSFEHNELMDNTIATE